MREVSSSFVPGCLSQQSCNASMYLTRLTNFVCLVPYNLELTRMLPLSLGHLERVRLCVHTTILSIIPYPCT
jgi:hypothetical protein